MPADDDELGFNKRIAPRQQVFGEAMAKSLGQAKREFHDGEHESISDPV